MKIKITLKDPDGVYECLEEAAKASVAGVTGLTDQERDDLAETRHKQIKEACSRWIEYSEYVTIEIDTDAGTAAVCRVGQ